MQKNGDDAGEAGTTSIATAFVNARLAGRALEAYPGIPPETLEAAYDIQNRAIGLWPDEIAGWKVGRIAGEAEKAFGTDRLAGPIFEPTIMYTEGAPAPMPVFPGGFAAVEAEIVIIAGEDAPADKLTWSLAEAAAIIGSIHAGVEVASSPFHGINSNGPLVTISDFGNNFGLVIGGEIPDWRRYEIAAWRCRTFIDGRLAGENSAAAIPGGPVESLRFLLEHTARRGLALKRGMAVCTGAVTGVHEVTTGRTVNVAFDGTAEIRCEIVDLPPADTRRHFSWLRWAVAGAALFLWSADGMATPARPAAAEIGKSLTRKEKVRLLDVPGAVLAVALDARPGMTIESAEREVRNGVVYYDLGGITADGAEIELDIMADGEGWRVVEIQRDITLAQTPAPVREALLARVPGIELARIIESDQADGVVIYEFFTRAADGSEKKYEVKYADGKAEFLEEEWAH